MRMRNKREKTLFISCTPRHCHATLTFCQCRGHNRPKSHPFCSICQIFGEIWTPRDLAMRLCQNGIVASHSRTEKPAFCSKGQFLVFSVLVVTFSSELRFRFRKDRWTHNWILHTFKPINTELIPKLYFHIFTQDLNYIKKIAGVTFSQ